MVACPNCGNNEARAIVKNGSIYRKRKENAPATPRGAKIMRYLCTKCGHTTRGCNFGLPETEEETEAMKAVCETTEDKERRMNGNVVAKICGRPDLVEREL